MTTLLPFVFPGIDNVSCAFQLMSPPDGGATRGSVAFAEGVPPDEIAANRADLLRAAGVRAFAEARQVHGDDILFEPGESSVREETRIPADGLATSRPGLALLVRTADCQPVLLAHRSGRHVAALHVGWRGNRMLFPYTAVRRFCERYGLRPGDVSAVRGPSLGPGRAEFVHYAAEWGGYFGKYFRFEDSTMDLWSMTRDQLHAAGIPLRQIYGIDMCTASLPDAFFSYRRDRAAGRQASLVWIGEGEA